MLDYENDIPGKEPCASQLTRARIADGPQLQTISHGFPERLTQASTFWTSSAARYRFRSRSCNATTARNFRSRSSWRWKRPASNTGTSNHDGPNRMGKSSVVTASTARSSGAVTNSRPSLRPNRHWRVWERQYNHERFSMAVQGRTPMEKLRAVLLVSCFLTISNMPSERARALHQPKGARAGNGGSGTFWRVPS